MIRSPGLLFLLVSALLHSAPALSADFPDSPVIVAGTVVHSTDSAAHDITLLGRPFDERELYLTGLYLRVDENQPAALPEQAGSGYEPRLQAFDVTGDGAEEILITAATGGSGGIMNGLICRIGNNGGVDVIFDTGRGVLTPVAGRFLVGYRASIGVLDTTVVLDLSGRKEYYEETGVYENGEPTGSVEPWIDPYGLINLVDVDGDGVSELSLWQSISGAAHVDRIARIRTVAQWSGNRWRIESIDIEPLADARIE